MISTAAASDGSSIEENKKSKAKKTVGRLNVEKSDKNKNKLISTTKNKYSLDVDKNYINEKLKKDKIKSSPIKRSATPNKINNTSNNSILL